MKVLVADDDAVSRRLVQSALSRWGYEVEAVADGEAALRALTRPGGPRLAILDWLMPEMDGPEVCRRLREASEGPYVYVMLLTARDSRSDLLEGMNAGADDYVRKPFDVHELRARVRAGRRVLELQAQLLAAQEALRVEATYDALTGLWNRRAVLAKLERELSRRSRDGSLVAVLMADLDHFKAVNDQHGHVVGDEVLREAAVRARAAVRTYDGVGRYGGEELLIVLPGCDAAAAAGLGERVRAAIGERPFAAPAGPLQVTISIGTACTAGRPEIDATALVRAADAALYRAKALGRDRVEAAAPDDYED